MSLPKINVPTFELELPSTKEVLSFRPFLVKEEKILLMSLQSGGTEEIVKAIKQIINNCILTPEDFDVNKFPIYDLEYIFLQIRMKSVSDKLKLRFLPRENTDCEECKKQRIVEADLNDAKVEFKPNHSKTVDLGGGLLLTMRYPGVKVITNFDGTKESTPIDEFFKLVWDCIDAVHQGNDTYSTKDSTLAEGIEFLESLKKEQFLKIEEFFKTMPKLKLNVEINCKKCGFKETYPIVGLDNFFV